MKHNYISKESGIKESLSVLDLCIVGGGPCIIMLIISLFATAIISPRLGGTPFIEIVIFFITLAIQMIIYISVFQAPFLALYVFLSKREKKHDENKSLIQASSCTSQLEENNTLEESLNDSNPSTFPSQNASQLSTLTSRQFAQRNEERRAKDAHYRHCLQKEIVKYVDYIMPCFIKEEDMDSFRNEIVSWTSNPKYKPKSFELQEELTTLDLRHFIWNIGKRLGKENGYDGQAMADFVKTLFPKVFKDISDDSIKNFTADPDKGKIKLDRPEPGKFSFHYENRGNYY